MSLGVRFLWIWAAFLALSLGWFFFGMDVLELCWSSSFWDRLGAWSAGFVVSLAVDLGL